MNHEILDLSLLESHIGDAGLVRDIVAKYLVHLETQLITLKGLCPFEDHTEEIHRIAHSIRGGTGNIGAAQMHRIAWDFERELKTGKTDACPVFIEKLWEAFITLKE
ncbi:MAG: Hpt domain-containing protein [Spirochaetales bacterium]|nr:Hpt domain-containing protein [Spirochaetales bacterium]